MIEMMPARPVRLAAAVVLLLCAVACTSDTPARSTATPVRPRPAERPSQSPADAKRDRVFPAVAALPFSHRVEAISTVRLDNQTWAVSQFARRGHARIGCEGSEDGMNGRDYVCSSEYGELLQLEGRRIVRAYPLPGVPARHIAITEDAVYCARQGDGAVGDSMVCRVDLRTHELTVRVFPHATEPGWRDRPDELPEGWTLDDDSIEVSRLVADDAGVWTKAHDKSWTRLDPETLEIVERDIERVTSDG
jgi:hypothetical protein